jgi:HEAT repeat protein
MAASALGQIGSPAKAAIPDLEKAVLDNRESVRAAAIEALAEIRRRSRNDTSALRND